MSFLDHAPAAWLARSYLENQLIGPVRKHSASAIARQIEGLASHQAHEQRSYLERPLLPRHERFRSLLDDVAIRSARASTGAAGINRRPLRRWHMLLGEIRHLEGLSETQIDSGARSTAIAAYDELRKSVEQTCGGEFAALGELPWSRDWILFLARQAQDAPGASFIAGTLPITRTPSAIHVPEIVLELEDLGLLSVRVDHLPSKVRQREALRSGIDAMLRDRFRRERTDLADTDATFRRWKGSDPMAIEIRDRIERRLDETHPRGRRPYAVHRDSQVRRDVNAWVRVKIEAEAPKDIANDAAIEVDRDWKKLLVREEGSRTQTPTTEHTVRLAVRRADALLMRAAI